MDVIIAINNQYMEMCKTMLFSLLNSNKKNDVVIHIFNKNLNSKNIVELEKFIKKNGGNSKIYELTDILFEGVSRVLERFSVEMFFRIIAYKILPVSIERALWLDSDLLVRSDLFDFYNQSFGDMELIVCRDAYSNSSFIQKIKSKMEIPEDHDYFNSGVILFNLKRIRENLDESQIIEIIEKYNTLLTYPDQDILNKLFAGKVKYCNEEIYNFQVNEIYRADVRKTIILHYAGERKPWIPIKAYPISNEYWKERVKMGDVFGTLRFYLIYGFWYVPKIIKRGTKCG